MAPPTRLISEGSQAQGRNSNPNLFSKLRGLGLAPACDDMRRLYRPKCVKRSGGNSCRNNHINAQSKDTDTGKSTKDNKPR